MGREPRDYGRKVVREKGRRLRFWMGKEAGREKDMSVMQCMCCRYRARKLRKKKELCWCGHMTVCMRLAVGLGDEVENERRRIRDDGYTVKCRG